MTENKPSVKYLSQKILPAIFDWNFEPGFRGEFSGFVWGPGRGISGAGRKTCFYPDLGLGFGVLGGEFLGPDEKKNFLDFPAPEKKRERDAYRSSFVELQE